ncbi:MAG: hypothetical protein MUP13_03270, partial [Thermoanaerobaculales bacterium]|nr:hypothetical protein [Thermoanaerobaculales bacterium]
MVITSYGVGRRIEGAVHSILEQTLDDVEVVDNKLLLARKERPPQNKQFLSHFLRGFVAADKFPAARFFYFNHVSTDVALIHFTN